VKLPDTKEEELLQVDLYDWCAQMAQREIDSNCKNLLRVKSSLATIYVEFMATSSDKAAKRASALSLVKRFHLPALRLKGDGFTDRDQQLVDDFLEFARRKRFSAKSAIPASRTRKAISKDSFSKALESLVDPLLGRAELLERSVRRYESAAGRYRIITFIELGGRPPLRYSHKILGRNGCTLCETSLLHWHGIATETIWDSMGPKDINASVELLANACQRFLAAIKGISTEPSQGKTSG
jgi:hypothetical protein